MKTKKTASKLILKAALAAVVLLPSIAQSGVDITTSNYVPGNFAAAIGYQNNVPGTVCFVAGQTNYLQGSYNTCFGFNSIVQANAVANLLNGGGHNVSGNFNTALGLTNTTGATASNALVGGYNNLLSGNQSFAFGSNLNDGGFVGNVILSDANAFNIRTTAARFTSTGAHRFTGIFNGGYFCRTNDGQGANPNAGVFIVPSAANTAAVSNPARVGINRLVPTEALDVIGNGLFTGDVEVGPASIRGTFTATGNGNGVQGVGIFDRTVADGTLVRFRRDGTTVGTIDVAGGVVTYNAFTGSHYAITDEAIERGMLVSLTGKNGRLEDRPESEILYGVTKSQRANDPAILGSYLARQNPAGSDLADSANPHLVTAVGNSEMWVIDTGRNLAPGEYLLSSAIAGHAMTDPGTFEVSYIIGRVAEPIDWKKVTATVKGPDGRESKRALVSIFFENFVIDRTHSRANDAEFTKLRAENTALAAKLTALEARDQAREARLARLEAAATPAPARAVPAVLDLKASNK